jgi:hypothetical protein
MLEEDRPKEYEKAKSTLLLSLYKRDKFHQFQLSNQPLYTGHTHNTSVIDEVKKLINSTNAEAKPSTIEEEMGMEKTFDAPTINLGEDQSVVIDSLIAKFGGNPSTIKKAAKILEPLANYSEGSLDEDEEIVSKTLAIIYAEQGYNGKAIKMLKKLSLIFPEKSSIFASHIEMIKNGKYNQIN